MQDDGHVERYLAESRRILDLLDRAEIEKLVDELVAVRERGGRLFSIGSGGGAAHASHAVCDFRKIAAIEAYAPADNLAELTARVNDQGWESCYADWLRGSRIGSDDLLLVFSVGGGDLQRGISPNLVRAVELARSVGARIAGIVGRDGGFTRRVADACVVIPTTSPGLVTPHTEGLQSMLAHLVVSHPRVAVHETTWESVR